MSQTQTKVKEHEIGDAPVAAGASAPATASTEVKPNWFQRNRWFTKEPVSYFGYQFFRSSMATIPYGFGMALFHHLFGLMSVKGTDMGLTEQGRSEFYAKMNESTPSGLKAGYGEAASVLEKVGAEAEALHVSGLRGKIGRNLVRLGNSPLNQALQIGLAFSMFRFTGGLIKTVRDKIMDEGNSPEDTQRETQNWWQTLKDSAKINWKAEAIGTFWGGLTLGFIGANFKQTTPYAKQAGETFLGAVKRVWSLPAKVWQNGALWTISYGTFFEVDERIQKDYKLREGTWHGHANSLTNGPAESTGKPIDQRETPDEKPKHAWFTHDPGLPRLVFRRLLPVAVGITGYAFMKRAGYIAAGGQMMGITPEIAHGGVGKNMGHFLKNAKREGIATATFGVLWAATDAWGSWYDRYFENMEKKPSAPMTQHQANNFAALHEKLTEKAAGRAA